MSFCVIRMPRNRTLTLRSLHAIKSKAVWIWRQAYGELIALSLLAGLGFGLALAHGDLLFVAVFGGAIAMTTNAMRRLR
jgi:hypothetical protein